MQNAKSLGSSFGNAKELSDIMTGSFKVQLINMGTRAAACKYATEVSSCNTYTLYILHRGILAHLNIFFHFSICSSGKTESPP